MLEKRFVIKFLKLESVEGIHFQIVRNGLIYRWIDHDMTVPKPERLKDNIELLLNSYLTIRMYFGFLYSSWKDYTSMKNMNITHT